MTKSNLSQRIQQDIKNTCIALTKEKAFIDIKYVDFKENKIASFTESHFIKNRKDYITQFKKIIEEKEHLAILKDGSLITVFYRFDQQGELQEASLAYYPNPNLAMSSHNFPEEIESHVNKEDYLSNYLRLDFNFNEKSEVFHPCTHVHIGLLSSFRIATDNFPFFSDFVEFILFLNYSEEWKSIYLNKHSSLSEYISKRSKSIYQLVKNGNLTPVELMYRYFKF